MYAPLNSLLKRYNKYGILHTDKRLRTYLLIIYSTSRYCYFYPN